MPDPQTQLNALMSGEIDYIESPPADLLPVLEMNPELTVRNLNLLGYQTIARMNFLHPPFDNPKVRRAAMLAMNQKDVLDAMIGNPKLYRLCGAMFICGTPLETSVGTETLVKGNGMEEARKLLKESGYNGTPVVLMHPTDVTTLRTQPVVGAQALRDAGFTVDLVAMDWQTLVGRRASKNPPNEGGWNMFFTNWVGADVFNPLVSLPVNGRGVNGGWFGWPEDAEIERLRDAFARATTDADKKAVAEKLQARAMELVMYVPLGEYVVPSAWSNKLSGVLDGPVPYFWNIAKK
jgi:peptide/nickel transport system substrate-binding protein